MLLLYIEHGLNHSTLKLRQKTATIDKFKEYSSTVALDIRYSVVRARALQKPAIIKIAMRNRISIEYNHTVIKNPL